MKYMVTQIKESLKMEKGEVTTTYEGYVELTRQEDDGSYAYDCVDLTFSKSEELAEFKLGQIRTVTSFLYDPSGEAHQPPDYSAQAQLDHRTSDYQTEVA